MSPVNKNQVTKEFLALGSSAMMEIFEFVAEGGTLIEFAERGGYSIVNIREWIAVEDERSNIYKQAKQFQGEALGEMVIRNLRRYVDMDIGQAYDKNGHLLPLDEMPESIRKCITGLETREEVSASEGDDEPTTAKTLKAKFITPEKALELLGRYRKMFTDKLVVDLGRNLEEILAETWATVKDEVEGKDDDADEATRDPDGS